jgi:YggT family protein
MLPISGLLALAFQAYFIILLVRVILSWMSLSSQRGIAANIGLVVYNLTEPLLRPVRNALRPYQGRSGIDFSPLVLWLVLSVVEQLALRLLAGMGL